jgi:hypothetical protein
VLSVFLFIHASRVIFFEICDNDRTFI